jgi:hypothetical protein
VVTECAQGWEVREEEGAVVKHDVIHDDWHRVERDLSLFDLRAATLRREGWIDNGTATRSELNQ